jgi:multiple sugar transport system ATP-binding protein
MASLSIDQVTKVYDNGLEAVKQIDLFVADGEFVVLVGPSGCGKTTVLRMVAGLEEITEGTISLDGKVVNDVSPRDRDVAMVFQNYALYPHLSVHQNIGFSLAMRHVPKDTRDQKVREAAKLLGLSDLLGAKPRHLSGGQRQRVAMGRALVREPAVFLMDEPLSNLDASLRVQMRAEVMHIQRRLGVATLYVTHDQTEAMTMGDRVAVMRNGALQQFASPQDLYDHPTNLFVAAFMGSPSMNLYESSIAGSSERLEVSLGSQRLVLPTEVACRRPELVAARGRELVVGVRPEELSLPTAGNGNESEPGATLLVDVELVEALGNEQLVHFATDAQPVREKTEWVDENQPDGVASGIAGAETGKGVARVDPRAHVAAGDRIALAVDIERLHFFERGSGDALTQDPKSARA